MRRLFTDEDGSFDPVSLGYFVTLCLAFTWILIIAFFATPVSSVSDDPIQPYYRDKDGTLFVYDYHGNRRDIPSDLWCCNNSPGPGHSNFFKNAGVL